MSEEAPRGGDSPEAIVQSTVASHFKKNELTPVRAHKDRQGHHEAGVYAAAAGDMSAVERPNWLHWSIVDVFACDMWSCDRRVLSVPALSLHAHCQCSRHPNWRKVVSLRELARKPPQVLPSLDK